MILTVTFNPAVDQTVSFEDDIAPNRVMRASSAQFDAAGKGVNVAQFLAVMGHSPVATGVLGGFTGQFIRERLAEAGVTADFVEGREPTRLNTTALADGEEYKLNHPGAAVNGPMVEQVRDIARAHDPDTVVVSGSLPPGMTTAAVDALAVGNWETVVDMAGPELRSLDERYALCTPNRAELAEATGAGVATVERCAQAAEAVRESGFDRVLASLGSDGAVLVTESTALHGAALPVDTVDTVGAGDALLSGVLGAWADGADDETALRSGVAFASRLVEQTGTAPPSIDGTDTRRDRVTVRPLSV